MFGQGRVLSFFGGRFQLPVRSAFIAVGISTLVLALIGEMDYSRTVSRGARSRNATLRSNHFQATQRSPLDTLRSTLRHYFKAFGHVPFIYPIINAPGIKKVLSSLPGTRAFYGSKWDKKHPFDRAYGTDTSGFLYGDDILTGHPAEEHGSPYAGVQPSILRTVLATLPNINSSTFIDLGCGKGRPMLIASEFPFQDIVGVELSPSLASAATRNAEIMARRHPERTRIRVDIGDATAYPYPNGDVVVFIYNSFDRELMSKVVESVEGAIKANPNRAMFVIYCNPASGDCFDASPLLTRRFAQMLPYAPDELAYAEDAEDGIIVWQGGNATPPATRADAEIVIVKERWRAVLKA